MPALTSNDINKIISFQLVTGAGPIVGTVFEKVKLKAILDAESTYQWIEPISLHANLFPVPGTPPLTPNRFNGYLYAKIEMGDGQITCIGLPFIDEGSIVIHENTTIQITINNVEPKDYNKIRDILLFNGFNDLSMDFVD